MYQLFCPPLENTTTDKTNVTAAKSAQIVLKYLHVSDWIQQIDRIYLCKSRWTSTTEPKAPVPDDPSASVLSSKLSSDQFPLSQERRWHLQRVSFRGRSDESGDSLSAAFTQLPPLPMEAEKNQQRNQETDGTWRKAYMFQTSHREKKTV